MIKDKGIRTLIPGVVTNEEENEIKDAREYIRKKLGVQNELPAPTVLMSDYLPSKIIEKLPAETKNEFGYTPSEEKEIEKQMVKANQEAERKDNNEKHRKQPLMRSWGLDKEKQKQKDNSSVKYVGSRQHLYDDKLENSKILKNNINNLKKEEVILDSKHPDGFRFAEDNDLYKNYGDTPVRYIQEIRYKYDGGAAPTNSVVKTFDGADASTFPSDPEQKKALAKYQMTYNKLSPLQKKQLETTKKAKI